MVPSPSALADTPEAIEVHQLSLRLLAEEVHGLADAFGTVVSMCSVTHTIWRPMDTQGSR